MRIDALIAEKNWWEAWQRERVETDAPQSCPRALQRFSVGTSSSAKHSSSQFSAFPWLEAKRPSPGLDLSLNFQFVVSQGAGCARPPPAGFCDPRHGSGEHRGDARPLSGDANEPKVVCDGRKRPRRREGLCDSILP